MADFRNKNRTSWEFHLEIVIMRKLTSCSIKSPKNNTITKIFSKDVATTLNEKNLFAKQQFFSVKIEDILIIFYFETVLG